MHLKHVAAWIPFFLMLGFSSSTKRAESTPKAEVLASIETEHPWINFGDLVVLPSARANASGTLSALETIDPVRPRSLTSADLDEDGVPDLLCGYETASGGLIRVYRGNLDPIYPNSEGALLRKSEGRFSDLPFFASTQSFYVPESPDFLESGDFNADGYFDVVAIGSGSSQAHLMLGDGSGGLEGARSFELPGRVTAVTGGEMNRADGLRDLLMTVIGSTGAQLLVYESPRGALQDEPETFELPTVGTDLELARLDGDGLYDVVVAAGREVLFVHGRDRRLSLSRAHRTNVPPANVDSVRVPFEVRELTVGNFRSDSNQGQEVALLSQSGNVHFMERKDDEGWRLRAGKWLDVLEESSRRLEESVMNLEESLSFLRSSSLMTRARVSSLPGDDLIVLDPGRSLMHILSDGIEGNNLHSDRGPVTLELENDPIAVLPMRLNSDALNDLVILEGDRSEPALALTVPNNTYVVNSGGDEGDLFGNDGICSWGTWDPVTETWILDYVCTLRGAIEQANSSPGADAISFSIGVTSVTSTGTLEIQEAVTIDGTSAGRVELTACFTEPYAGDSCLVVKFYSGNSVVRGLAINNSDRGILVDGVGNIIEDNYLGTDTTGTFAMGNRYGIEVGTFGNSNVIGGTVEGARNLISGNTLNGIIIGGEENFIQGNFIGTDITGTVGFEHDADAVTLGSNNTLGGTSPGAANVIFAQFIGVTLWGSLNLVQGNLIGTDATGENALSGNGGIWGVYTGSNNTVGGTTPASRNIISGNWSTGVLIEYGEGNLVQGNYIGTDISGTVALGNAISGIDIGPWSPDNVVGGSIPGAGNLISGNGAGVSLWDTLGGFAFTTGNIVQGNYIGVDATGTVALPNSGSGVAVAGRSFENTIGGTELGEGNLIAFNGEDGVAVESGTGNAIRGNAIGNNAGLGINLGLDGVTLNDDGDVDIGANNLQNFPELILATNGLSETIVDGHLISTPSTTFTLDFYRNDSCDSSYFGEGQEYLGSTLVTTNPFGDPESFSVSLPELPTPSYITATATDPENNTSEFSACLGFGVPFDPPDIFINDVSRVEGDSGTANLEFAVSLSGPTIVGIRVDYATADGTATAGSDYEARSGTLIFPPQTTEKTVEVAVFGDAEVEFDEIFSVNLSEPVNADIIDDQGIGTIIDDDCEGQTLFSDDIESGASNWTTSAGAGDAGTDPWSIVATDSQSPTQSWFVSNDEIAGDQALVMSSPVTIPSAGSRTRLEFWHRYDVEGHYDGGVLEYSLDDGGSWQDILSGDGSSVPANESRFLLNGYNDTISTCCSNPLGDRDAWSGDSSGWQRVQVDLEEFADKSIRFRWRFGSDESVDGQGWWVDDVRIVACNVVDGMVFDELAVDFSSNGLWHYENLWDKLSSWDPENLISLENRLAADFGSRGLWLYEAGGWTKITSWNPEDMVAWNDCLVVDFGVNGIWMYCSGVWTKLTTWNPEKMIAWGDKLAADFGSQGIWFYETGGWTKITSWDPEDMVAWNDCLIVDFGVNRMWMYCPDMWTKLTTWNPEQVVAWGDKLAADFGAGRGLWLYETSGWTKITSWDPEDMVAWGDKLAADFGSRGLWLYSSTGWTKITSWDPERMEAMADQLAGDFGSSRGLWLHETSWTKITSWDPEDMEDVNLLP